MKKSLYILTILFAILGCTVNEDRSRSLVNVFLVDAPADIDALWLEVLGVEIETTEDRSGGNGVISSFNYEAGNKMVDITQLVGGQELLIGRGEVNSGNLSRIKLRLGNEKYIIQNNARTNLNFPTEAESALSLNVNFNLRPGISHDIYIDFDVLKSLFESGPQGYTLIPSLRFFSKAQSGEIEGRISPAMENPFLYAIQQNDTITTGVNIRENGEFLFRGLEGTYTILVVPRDDRFLRDTIRTVIVQSQQRTQLGNITLQPNN